MKTTTPLTEQEIEGATPKVKEYSLGDGKGLYLKVKPSGSTFWHFNYTYPFTNKRTNLSFGSYPDISLEQARKMRADARALLVQKIDPKQYRDAKIKEETEVNQFVFENVVIDWLKVKSSELKPIGFKIITNSLENFILPFVGTCSVKDINAKLVMEVLQPIKNNGDVQVLMQNYLYFYQIMNHAKSSGLIDHNPLNKLNVTNRYNQ